MRPRSGGLSDSEVRGRRASSSSARTPKFNPVGFGAMVVASAISIAAYFGAFGPELDAWSPFLAIAIAMVLSVVLSIVFSKRDAYIAREPTVPPAERSTVQGRAQDGSAGLPMAGVAG